MNLLMDRGVALSSCTFFLVVLRHLVFFLSPVPGWIAFLQPFGIFCRHISSPSRLSISNSQTEQGKGVFPVIQLLPSHPSSSLSVTGVLLRTSSKADLVAVKGFVLDPGSQPSQCRSIRVFVIHFFPRPCPLSSMSYPYICRTSCYPGRTTEEEKLKTLMHGEKSKWGLKNYRAAALTKAFIISSRVTSGQIERARISFR